MSVAPEPAVVKVPQNPCQPNPCGPYSQCRVQNGVAVCSCLPEYIGTSPNCRPECFSSSECDLDKACVNQKCIDPCPGPCAPSAICRVLHHSPICSCPPNFIGDPFNRCYQPPKVVVSEVKRPENPCIPSPCGGYADCRVINEQPACSCQVGYLGSPPNCRPECVMNGKFLNFVTISNRFPADVNDLFFNS